jgi:pimeloyl-ACP methyl ester carboxylesterase
MNEIMHGRIQTVFGAGLALGCASMQGMPAPTAPALGSEAPAAAGVLDGRVESEAGLRLHIRCVGEGQPVVVFDSGLGQGAEAWAGVQPRVAAFTRACAYDRASHGESDPARVPHSNRKMARELYALLQRAQQPGPYVLVGHSMGGTNVQLLLEEQAASVAGMVLLDASPDPPPIADIPAPMLADFERNIATLEGLDLKTLLAGFDELRASPRTLGDKPLAILVAGKAPEGPHVAGAGAEAVQRSREQAQRALGSLSTNSVLVVVPESGHHVPNDAPEVVIGAINAVVKAARSGERLDAAGFRR